MRYQTTEKIFPAMGTVFSLVLRGAMDQMTDAPVLLKNIRRRMLELDDTLSLYKQNSELSRINRVSGKKSCPVSRDTFHIFQIAAACSSRTEGAFDITAGDLSLLWKNRLAEQRIPGQREIYAARQLADYRKVVLTEDSGSCRIFLRKRGMTADLGGIAKGYAAGLAAEMIRQAGISDALINFGGTILSIGPEKEIGIQNPFFRRTSGEPIIGKLRIKNQAVVTSSSGEQHWTIGGKEYHHIIDPRTGYPSASDIRSVTLVGGSATELDALATGCMVLGIQKSLPILQAEKTEGIFIRPDGAVLFTPGLRPFFHMEAPAPQQNKGVYA